MEQGVESPWPPHFNHCGRPGSQMYCGDIAELVEADLGWQIANAVDWQLQTHDDDDVLTSRQQTKERWILATKNKH